MPQSDSEYKPYLVDIRDALIHSLSTQAGLSGADIADLFGVNRSTVSRALRKKNKSYVVTTITKTIRKKENDKHNIKRKSR